MTIPMKYEDVVAQLDAALGREAALREELEMAKQVQEVTDAVVTMVDGQRDRWIEKCGLLKQRLTVAERRNTELVRLLRSLNDCTDWWGWGVDESLRAPVEAALKPAEEVEALGTRPVGCCCPPKGHTGIWAAAMCPVHFGLKRPGVSHDQ